MTKANNKDLEATMKKDSPKPDKKKIKEPINNDTDDELPVTDDELHKTLDENEKQKLEELKAKKRQQQAQLFEHYIEQSGMTYAFEIIFTEIIAKQIREDQVFAFTAMRLRQLGKDLDSIDKNKDGNKHEDSD